MLAIVTDVTVHSKAVVKLVNCCILFSLPLVNIFNLGQFIA